jgi:hypothetical protein
MANGGIYYWRPLLPQLERLGIEMDQRMQQAWEMCASKFVTEVQLLTALLQLNARGLQCLPENWLEVAKLLQTKDTPNILNAFPAWDMCRPEYAEIAARVNFPIWMHTIELAGKSKTVSCHHFCRAIAETLLEPWQGEPANVPPIIDFLGFCHNEQRRKESLDFANVPLMLEEKPKTRRVIEALAHVPPEPDDFQYALCIEQARIVFRAVSVVGDFAMRTSDGGIVGNRGLLTHFKERFGVFTPEEIGELEDMIRSTKASEGDFQKFFESHQHFFRRWDYREVYSQVYLTPSDEGGLVPDFILTNPEAQEAVIVELKLPKAKLIRRQQNRDRFADAVMQARAQLLEYQDWFMEKENRESLIKKVKMEIFRPSLAVVIGRSADFNCAIDRQRLGAHTSDIEIVTYDDMLAFARRRIVAIRGQTS